MSHFRMIFLIFSALMVGLGTFALSANYSASACFGLATMTALVVLKQPEDHEIGK